MARKQLGTAPSASNDTATKSYADGKVADAINDGTTTVAPSQNAVFDALANKQPLDADLTTVAGLTATSDNFIQSKSSAWASRTPAQVAADLAVEIGKLLHPVGCIYTSVNSTNPATSLGFGTWTAFGAGRVPVGYDSGQTEFDTDEETGGAKTVTLTSTEMPAHTHNGPATGDGNMVGGGSGGSGASIRIGDGSMGYRVYSSPTTGSTGGGGAHNNLQPYIVVRMWKRTA